MIVRSGDRPHFKAMQALQQRFLDRVQVSSFPEKDARDTVLYRVCAAINMYCLSIGFEMVTREVQGHADLSEQIQALTLQGAFGNTGITRGLKFFRARRRAELFLAVWNAFEDALRIVDLAVVPAAVRAKDDSEYVGIPSIWKRVSRVAKARRGNARATNHVL